MRTKIVALVILAADLLAAALSGDWGALLLGVSFIVGMLLEQSFMTPLLAAANRRTEKAWIAADRAQGGWQESNETNARLFAAYTEVTHAFRNHLLGRLSADEALAVVERHMGDIHQDPPLHH